MKTIIAPTDFSESSLNAVNYAADMAVDIKANLLLLHIVDIPATVITEFPVTEIGYHQVSRIEDLRDLQQTLLARTNNSIEITTSELTGNINNEIKATCEVIKPFAVIMCTHSQTAIERFFFGCVTAYSTHHLHSPVINVPAGSVYKPVKKIAFASDCRDVFHLPVEEIKSIARAFDAGIEILYVGSNEASLAAVETEKSMLLKRLGEPEPGFHFVINEDLEQGIEIFTSENKVDLVLVVPHSHGLFHKSKSEQVVFHLPMPALTIHAE